MITSLTGQDGSTGCFSRPQAQALRRHIERCIHALSRSLLSVRASTIGSVEPCYSIRIARRFIRLAL